MTPPPVLAAFVADLRAHDSASEVLGRVCAAQRPRDPAIRAMRAPPEGKPADAEVRRRLRARPGEAIAYRHVRLTCGDLVLSEADNWYLPDRLTPEMNRRLTTSDTPFGQVVRPLAFHRERIASRALWAVGAPPPYVLRQSAVLLTGAGAPFSYVVERYTPAALGR